MSNHLNHTEMIDAYLTGNLNAEDAALLMKRIEQDPALKEEFLLQKDLVHSLQNKRRSELKARLDNIEVGPGYSLPSAVSFKMIAGAAFVALLGTGAYFAYDQFKDQPKDVAAKEISAELTEKASESLPALPEVEKSEALVFEEEKAEEAVVAELPVKESAPVEKTETSKAAPKVVEEAAPKEKEINEEVAPAEKPAPIANTAEVVKPEVITFNDQDPSGNIPEVDVPEDKLKNARKFDTQNIEVTTKTDNRYPFHYMFFDNQLSIYGDFSKVPYEVLEVNTGTQTSYFLYHNGKYYQLNPKQEKITRLKELTNKKLIQELESTRNKKLQH